jgi:oxalate decarboxylase/phosphoglucose isomerase-like protein (cupin superfamily)
MCKAMNYPYSAVLCIAKKIAMLMENPEGDWDIQYFSPGKVIYVPPRFAHRSINLGNDPLVTFFTFTTTVPSKPRDIENLFLKEMGSLK